MVVLGKTRHGELVEMNRRAAESDLVIYVNINLVPMDGGHKSIGVGLCGYESLKAHHTPKAIVDSNSFMDPPSARRCRTRSTASGACRREARSRSSTSRPSLNNRTFERPLDFLMKNEDDFTEADRLKFQAHEVDARQAAVRARAARSSCARPRAYELIACYAGAASPTHDKTLDQELRAVLASRSQGQADILITGIPYISSVQRELQGAEPAARAGAWRSATTITCTGTSRCSGTAAS